MSDETERSPASVHAREEALIGRTISGRYKITAPIAAGGMGAVFRGEHLHMRKHVAIKILHAETEGLEGLAAQFEREAVAGAHIEHTNVASATDFGELDDGSYFLVLEFVKGVTLEKELKKGPISVDRAVTISRQIAAGLQASHAKGIVHRDIKSANVMLTTDGEEFAKVIDFGFAKVPVGRLSLAGEDDPLSTEDVDPDTVFGTIHYLAPEAAGGMDQLDGRSDLYALGIIMYEMLTGSRPFTGDKFAEVFRMHRKDAPPPFFERAPMIPVPAALEAIVMRLLAKDPDERFQTGDEVIAALNRVAAAKKLKDRPQIDLSDIDIPPPRGSRFGQLVTVLFILGGVAGIVWFVPAARHKAIELGLPLPPPAAGESEENEDTKKVSEVDGLGAGAWTARLLGTTKSRDYKEGASALRALAQLDPTALATEQMSAAATTVAVNVATSKAHADLVDGVYDALASGFGSDGLDVLYGIVETKPPRSPATLRAFKALTPEALDQASPAVRIAVELRTAECKDKPALFARAAKDGDARVLKVLKPLRYQPCRKGPKDPCCFRQNLELQKALTEVTARVKRK